MLKFWRCGVIRLRVLAGFGVIKCIHTMGLHSECRNKPYVVCSQKSISRLCVPDEKVSWLEPWPSYKPPVFTVPGLNGHPWADPDMGSPGFRPRWNRVDDGINRVSLIQLYDVEKGFPLNPCGRTGLAGRGRLGRWGPNHAVDAIVTRWKNSGSGRKMFSLESNYPILQVVSIQRRDTGEWAFPGGFVEDFESPSNAVQREFLEEALNTSNIAGFFNTQLGNSLKEFFDKGEVVYKGYVDDPRNTDNAWIETTAHLFHDEENAVVSLLEIEGGDDASRAQWVDVRRELSLYANHLDILGEVVSLLGAHW